MKELEQAIRLNGSDPETHYDLGKTDLEMRKHRGRDSGARNGCSTQPDDASFHRELASAYERVFRMADAEKERHIAEQLKAAHAVAEKGGASPEGNGPSR